MAELDKIIHERARLSILTYLAGRGPGAVSFNELQEKLSLTSGNLSIQLKKLREAGYVGIHKTFKDNKPYTTARITEKGNKALQRYINEMEGIIQLLKQQVDS